MTSLEMIFVCSHTHYFTEKLLSHIDVYAAGPPLLISITCPETCVQRVCDKKRSGTKNVTDVNRGPNRGRAKP
jgi:hypothetical protein